MTERTVEESIDDQNPFGQSRADAAIDQTARLLQVDRLGEGAVDLEPIGQNLAGLHGRRADQNGQWTAGRGPDDVEQLLPRLLWRP